jgi:ABC-type sugar transport system ATPase subunit
MTGVEKSYPGVHALRGVSLTLAAGEVLAVVGENGAGKSTLIKVLAGAVAPDAGRVAVAGRVIPSGRPAEAKKGGIAVIYQEFSLVPALTTAENVYLGREPGRFGWLHRRAERAGAAEWFRTLGVPINPDAPVSSLSTARQQVVEIAKALAADARLLVLDEPTAPLSPPEVERLFGVIRGLTDRGVGVIYISHRLDEVFRIADRVMILRDGTHVATASVADVTRTELIEKMVGRKLDQEFPTRSPQIGEPRLVVSNLRRGTVVKGVSFQVRRGEILALTGLVGSGRTETARLLFGADRRDGGTVSLDGKALTISSPRDAIRSGIALLTEDRKGQGLILAHSVRDNFALPNLPGWSRLGALRRALERAAYRVAAERFRIAAAGPGVKVGTLSGGNQQKVVLAKWLERNCEVILFDEPTRGIDVGAKYELYQMMQALADRGKAVLMVSSELPEVLGLADRVLVMHGGRIVGEVTDVAHATQEQVLQLAMG